MRLRYHFLVLSVLLMLSLGFFIWQLARPSLWGDIAVGSSLLAGLAYLPVFYSSVIRPLKSIESGMDLLREQDFSSRLRSVGQYEADGVVKIFNRMMEQLKHERLSLRETNEFLDLLIHASPMGVVVLDYDRRVSHANPAARRILLLGQKQQVEGWRVGELCEATGLALIEVPLHGTRSLTLHDGSIYKCTLDSFVDKGFPRWFYLIESLTDEVRKAEKTAYEQVIRMIAHEVNNTTAGITSTLDTLISLLPDERESAELAEVMRVCVERCYSMSKFITNFADVVRIPEANLRPTNLNLLVSNEARLMEGVCMQRGIRMSLELDSQLEPVELDTQLLEGAVQNILKNAAESIETDGEIRISTSEAERTLIIADNGAGISKEVAEQLFRPFFSTKRSGQGIGLIFIREVMLRHGFRYSLSTHADGWTRFIIYLGQEPAHR